MKKRTKRTRPSFLGFNRRNLAVLAGCLALAGWMGAEPRTEKSNGDLQISLTARKVILDAEGREALELAERAAPGEVVQYDAVYHNRGQAPMGNVLPTLPIPAGTIYVPEGTQPAPAEASLDGKQFYTIPLKRTVTRADGRVEEEVVPSSEYRALRWTVGGMKAGQTVAVVARVRIEPTLQ